MADCVWESGDGADVKCVHCWRPRMVAANGKPIARNCRASATTSPSRAFVPSSGRGEPPGRTTRAKPLGRALAPRPPGVLAKAKALLAVEARWIAAGRPMRTADKIAAIFEICRECEHFQAKNERNGTCGLCGCRLKQTGGLLNKIAMATESCPAGKWPAVP